MSFSLVTRLQGEFMNSGATAKVLFVDLDGTLILDNSYHLFLWSLWVKGGSTLRITLVRAFLVRMLRSRDGRTRMKRSLLHAFARTAADRQLAVLTNTLAKMRETVSRPVLERVSAFRDSGWLTVLATAAPDCYAKEFAYELKFDACLASPSVTQSSEWVELIGARKADACRAWAEAVAGTADAEIAVISDHCDDLPLLQMASRVVIQAPPDDAVRIISGLSAGTLVEQIDPVGPDETGGIWLWINDRATGPYDSWEVKTILSKHRYALMYQGDSRWRRVLPGQSLTGAARRVDCPLTPTPRDRMSVAARRFIVRDCLGVFH